MFRNLMNGVSLSAMMLRDGNNDDGTPDPKIALREKLAKGNVQQQEEPETDIKEKEEEGETEEDDEEEEEGEEEEGEVDPNETPEQKADREAKAKELAEKTQAKAQRKQDRMQRRIDRAIADKKMAETEIEKLKQQLAANPDQKLTAEEVETRAEEIARKKLADKELASLQQKFDEDCDKLQKAANKVDKNFDTNIHELAEDIGPIPSFMIGVLNDLDNGGAVLAHIAKDDELAEEIWKAKPAKMTRRLLEISKELADAAKPPKKQISKVPDSGEPVKANRVISNVITEADTKNMDNYVAKRQRQMAEQRKLKYGN